MWLYGIPGCGKTILSSSIIQDTIQRSNDDPTNAVAFYYFDFNEIQKQRVRPNVEVGCCTALQAVSESPFGFGVIILILQ